MIYTKHNALGATTHEVDTKLRIERVMQVDTDKNEVQAALHPYRLTHDGESVETETIRYRSIYPIYAGSTKPCAFHCYGRIG